MNRYSTWLSVFIFCFCSLKGFSQFTALNGPYLGSINDLVRISGSPNIFIAATANGLYRSTDGTNWTRSVITLPGGGTASNFQDLEVHPVSGLVYAVSFQNIFTSSDNGVTWAQVTATGLPVTSLRRVKVAPNGNIWVAAFDNRLYRANAATPTVFNSLFLFGSSILDLDISPASSSTIVVCTNSNGIQVSTNNGVSFNPTGPGIATTASVLSAAIVSSGGAIFAMVSGSTPSGGIFRSTDNGASWTSITANITDTAFFGFLDIDASNNLFVVNNSSVKLYSVGAAGALATPSWSSSGYPVSESVNSGAFQSLTNWQLGFSSYAIASTTNGGGIYTQTSIGIKASNGGGTQFPRLFRAPNTNRLLMSWQSGGIFVSVDDGANWDLLNTPASNLNRIIYGFVLASDNSIIAYGPGGVVRSTDNAQTWNIVSAITNHLYMANIGATLYSVPNTCCGPRPIQVSSDNGATWNTTLTMTGLPATYNITKLIAVSNSLYILVTGSTSNGLYSVNPTTGACTLVSNLPFLPVDIAAAGSTMAAVSGTSMVVSTDNAANWVTRSITTSVNRVWVADNQNFLTFGVTGSVLLSNNQGASWTSLNLGDATGNVTDAFFTTQGFAYLTGGNMTVQKSNTVVTVPLAPTNLVVLSKGSGSNFISWDDNSVSESGYEIEASVGNNTSYARVSVTSAFNVLQNKGITTVSSDPTTATFLRVRAVNQAGASAYSNEISVTSIPTCTRPASDAIPDNRSWTATVVADPGFTPANAGPFGGTNVAISTTTNAAGTSTVFLPDVNFNMSFPSGSISGVGVNITEQCGQTVLLGISPNAPFLNNGNGTWNPVTKTLVVKWQLGFTRPVFKGTTTYVLNASDPAPSAPVLTANIYSPTEVFLSWSVPSFATSFVIERSLTPATGFTAVSGSPVAYPANTFLDGGLTAGQTYYYRIRGVNASGTSANSAEISIQPSTSTLFRPVVSAISQNFENQQGVSWGDLDGDGDEDLASPSFVNNLNQNVPPVFYRNDGGGVFVRVDLPVLADENQSVSRGIGLFDFDNDSDLDMLIARSGSGTISNALLLINNGNWSFTKISLDQTTSQNVIQFRGVGVTDYDRDGLTDVFLGTSDGVAETFPALQLKNNGTALNLVTSGVFSTDLNGAITLAPADYDNDGDQDIFMVNRFSAFAGGANKLFRNNGDGTFSLVTGSIFSSELLSSCRTASWGDIDNDGDLDLYVGSINTTAAPACRLYQNNGNGTFTVLTTSAVAENISTYGSAFGDIDNDADVDLIAVGNGCRIYLNNGAGVFTKSTSQEILTNTDIFSIGGAFVDYDNDGFLDFYPPKGNTNAVNLPNLLYKNTLTAGSTRNWLEVRLRGTTSNRAALGARITITTTSPARTQIREVMASTGYGSQNSLVQHFGLGAATSVNQIVVRWPNGGTQTISTPTPANQIITITEDVVGPTFTLQPANGATAVPPGNLLRVTLNEAATAVAGKNIVVRKGSATSSPVQTISATAGVASTGNVFTFTLATPFDPLTQYFISIDAGAFVDSFNNPSLAVTPTQWSFTTNDPVPPIVSVTASGVPNSIAKGSVAGAKFIVTATDNVSVASVVMSYRKITATQFQTLNGVAGTAANTFEFPLQASFFDDMGMEFFFTAKDPSNNTTLFPTTGNLTCKLTFSATTIALGVAAGTQVADYKIISIPLDLASPNIANIFNDFGAPDPSQWKLLKYQQSPAPAWLAYPNSFSQVARGEGYFILSRQGQNLKFDGATAPSFTQSNLFQLTLAPGFNLIGNPYTMGINWEDSRSGISGVGAVKVFQGGNYVDGNSIEPFSGGFVLNSNTSATTVPIKLRTSPNGGRLPQSTIASRIDEPEWILPIKLVQDERQFNFGGVGMSPRASFSFDDLDDCAPPSPMGKFELAFAHPEFVAKKFSRDIVPNKSGFTWEFLVETENTGSMLLQWDNTELKNSATEIFLFDVSQQRPVNMKNTSSYSFSRETSSTFRVYFGTDAAEKLKPNGLFLGASYPNPVGAEQVTIPFSISDAAGDANVVLEIYDGLGKRVETLLSQKMVPGFYEGKWNPGQSEINNGLYVIRLSTFNGQKMETVSSKIMILK